MGVHDADSSGEHGAPAGTHDISFYCDDIHTTAADVMSRGVGFDGEVVDAGFGLAVHFEIPGGARVQLYQPHYEKRTG